MESGILVDFFISNTDTGNLEYPLSFASFFACEKVIRFLFDMIYYVYARLDYGVRKVVKIRFLKWDNRVKRSSGFLFAGINIQLKSHL